MNENEPRGFVVVSRRKQGHSFFAGEQTNRTLILTVEKDRDVKNQIWKLIVTTLSHQLADQVTSYSEEGFSAYRVQVIRKQWTMARSHYEVTNLLRRDTMLLNQPIERPHSNVRNSAFLMVSGSMECL